MNKHCLTNLQIEEKLLQAGVTPTAQRIAICQYVLCQASHPNAEDVKKWVDKHFPKLSMATVYNTLGVLVKAGLLKEIHFDDSETVRYDQNISKHHHFIDEKTGQIYDIEPCDIDVKYKLGKGFKVQNIDVIIRGRAKS